MVLTLYKLDGSPPVRAVLMTLEYLGIPDVEFVDVNLFTADHMKDDFLKLNPQHTIPTLKDDDFVIWDSHAITAYLVGKYADNDSLYPKDLKKRALVDQRLHFDTGILFPACRYTLAPVLFAGDKAFKPENLARITAGYEFIEKFLASSPYLVGDELTLADICCVATISSMDIILPIDASAYPNLTAWFEKLQAEDFYKKANKPGCEALAAVIRSKIE